MSGFEALGAAAAILQLVETGIKLGNKAVALYESKSGLEKRLASLDKTTTEFRSRNTKLIEKSLERANNSSPADGDDALQRIAIRCEQTAAELQSLIEQVRMKEYSKWNALVSTWKSERKRDAIEAKQQELKQWRRECESQLNKMMHDDHFALARTLREVSQRQRDSETTLSKQLMSFKREVPDILNKSGAKGYPALAQKLLDAQNTGALLLPREDILSSLFFPEIQVRWDGIARPTSSTYGWIFNRDEAKDPPVRYTKWLEEEGGIFWITGRAGSGKSTLMKYIRHHRETDKSLHQWANGRQVCTADYYFWYRGDGLQNSHEGLLRSIFYKLLSQCPSLIKTVCKSRWQQAVNGSDTRRLPWTVTELEECANTLTDSRLKVEGQDVCFCFFVDGLDEYRGNTEDVIRILEKLVQGPHIKICASSRPWNEFKFAFDSSSAIGNSIELHLHTTQDIQTVVSTELDVVLKRLGRDRAELDSLVAKIIDMAKGVFLWVVLVLKRELIPMLKALESVEKLEERLGKFQMVGNEPTHVHAIADSITDLTEYFQAIFDRVWKDKWLRTDTARIFRTCITSRNPIPLACLDVMTKDDPRAFVHEAAIGAPFNWGDPLAIRAATAQVNARCLDLLVVEAVVPFPSFGTFGPYHPRGLYCLTFLHRTVADFLTESAVAEDLGVYSGPEFDTYAALFACYAFLVKKSPAFGYDFQLDARYKAMDWSSSSLYYCAKSVVPADSQTTNLIADVDQSMARLYSSVGASHWTNYMVAPPEDSSSHDFFNEGLNRDMLGHLIEFKALEAVKAQLTKTQINHKRGRPYLDYALRFDKNAAFRRPDQTMPPGHRRHIVYDPRLVEFLLSRGCSVNEQVWTSDGRTVWDLYLAFLHDSKEVIDKASALQVTQLLINAGAKDVPRCIIPEKSQETTAKYQEKVWRYEERSMQQVLLGVFGETEARHLVDEVKQNNRQGWFSWMPLRWL